jgi:hypothetical protein
MEWNIPFMTLHKLYVNMNQYMSKSQISNIFWGKPSHQISIKSVKQFMECMDKSKPGFIMDWYG